jgi:hypothetical protein
LIYLTDFGKEKENYLKNTVLKFNETVKQHISEEKLQHFIEVADTINELIIDKNIFNPTSVNELTEKIENEIA